MTRVKRAWHTLSWNTLVERLGHIHDAAIVLLMEVGQRLLAYEERRERKCIHFLCISLEKRPNEVPISIKICRFVAIIYIAYHSGWSDLRETIQKAQKSTLSASSHFLLQLEKTSCCLGAEIYFKREQIMEGSLLFCIYQPIRQFSHPLSFSNFYFLFLYVI